MGLPVLIGWTAGHPTDGLLATLGAFAALYGYPWPPRRRAAALPAVAAGLLFAAGAGAWAAQVHGFAIPVVATVAAAATWICRAWEVGPPGPYPFTLVCAVGTAVGAAQRDPWHLVALVAGGGLSACVVHLARRSWPAEPRWPGDAAALRRHPVRALRPSKEHWRLPAQVGAAALAAGLAAGALGAGHAYWAAAVAVAVLHPGLGLAGTLRRGAARLGGTWAGLLLTGVVLDLHPQGVYLVILIAAAQFCVEMAVARNYTVATVFITLAALTIVTGGSPGPDLSGLLLARGVDTAVGCAVAVTTAIALGRRTMPPPRQGLLGEAAHKNRRYPFRFLRGCRKVRK
jgi:hypothetical protein